MDDKPTLASIRKFVREQEHLIATQHEIALLKSADAFAAEREALGPPNVPWPMSLFVNRQLKLIAEAYESATQAEALCRADAAGFKPEHRNDAVNNFLRKEALYLLALHNAAWLSQYEYAQSYARDCEVAASQLDGERFVKTEWTRITFTTKEAIIEGRKFLLVVEDAESLLRFVIPAENIPQNRTLAKIRLNPHDEVSVCYLDETMPFLPGDDEHLNYDPSEKVEKALYDTFNNIVQRARRTQLYFENNISYQIVAALKEQTEPFFD